MINFINVLQNLWPLLLVIFGLLVVAILNYHAAIEVGKVKQLAVDCMTDAAKSRTELKDTLGILSTTLAYHRDVTLVNESEFMNLISGANTQLKLDVGYIISEVNAKQDFRTSAPAGYLVCYVWIAPNGLGGCRYGFEVTDLPPDQWVDEKICNTEKDGNYIPTQFIPLSSGQLNSWQTRAQPLPTRI